MIQCAQLTWYGASARVVRRRVPGVPDCADIIDVGHRPHVPVGDAPERPPRTARSTTVACAPERHLGVSPTLRGPGVDR
jgi:hypothetical protein